MLVFSSFIPCILFGELHRQVRRDLSPSLLQSNAEFFVLLRLDVEVQLLTTVFGGPRELRLQGTPEWVGFLERSPQWFIRPCSFLVTSQAELPEITI